MALKGQFLFFFLNKHYAQLTSILLQDLTDIFGIYTFYSGGGCFGLEHENYGFKSSNFCKFWVKK